MPARALTVNEVARELGLGVRNLNENWRELVGKKRLPPPLSDKPLVWSAAHVYAWLDRDLPVTVRALAAAFRAALDAAQTPRDPLHDDEVERWRAELNRRHGDNQFVA